MSFQVVMKIKQKEPKYKFFEIVEELDTVPLWWSSSPTNCVVNNFKVKSKLFHSDTLQNYTEKSLNIHTCITQFCCGCCCCWRCCLPVSLDSLDLLLLLDLKLTDFLTDNFRPIIFRKLSFFFWPGGVRPHSGHLQNNKIKNKIKIKLTK